MDQERPFKADHAIQTGGAGRRPTNGAACPPSRVGAREGDHATPGLDPGDGGGGAGRKSDALALPQNRKWRRNPLIKRKTDSEMARRAQTRETPQGRALASGVPEADRGGAAGRNGAAARSAGSRARNCCYDNRMAGRCLMHPAHTEEIRADLVFIHNGAPQALVGSQAVPRHAPSATHTPSFDGLWERWWGRRP